MIREQHRREILQRKRTMRRFDTLAKSARWHYYEKIREAHAAGATPTELSKLLGLSISRTKQILYKEDKNEQNI